MKKKIIIFIVVVLILVAGGFFWWQGKEIKGNPEDYVIKETPEGKIVENKKAGLFVKAPEGWETKRVDFIEEGSILIQILDIEGEDRGNGIVGPPLIRGCGIETVVTYKKLSLEEIKKDAEEVHWMLVPIFDEFEEIVVNAKKALKNTWESKTKGPMIAIYIPIDNKVYTFTLAWAPNDKEKCLQEFNKFLETISIR
jgi:hypothetical protein